MKTMIKNYLLRLCVKGRGRKKLIAISSSGSRAATSPAGPGVAVVITTIGFSRRARERVPVDGPAKVPVSRGGRIGV
jgi:hypothetical protein